MISQFSVNRRNVNHWDVWSDVHKERIFRIRGGGHEKWDNKEFMVIGEHSCRDATKNDSGDRDWLYFETLELATAWIMTFLMKEDN